MMDGGSFLRQGRILPKKSISLIRQIFKKHGRGEQYRSSCRPALPVPRRSSMRQCLQDTLIMVSPSKRIKGLRMSGRCVPIELELFDAVHQRQLLQSQNSRNPSSALQKTTNRTNSYSTFHSFSNGFTYYQTFYLKSCESSQIKAEKLPAGFWDRIKTPQQLAWEEIQSAADTTAEPQLATADLREEFRKTFEEDNNSTYFAKNSQEVRDPDHPSKRSLKKQLRKAEKRHIRKFSRKNNRSDSTPVYQKGIIQRDRTEVNCGLISTSDPSTSGMPSEGVQNTSSQAQSSPSPPAQHKPLPVRTKPQTSTPSTMATSSDQIPSDVKAAVNHEIEENVKSNTTSAAPATSATEQPTKKKEKAPKQPKPPKAAPPSAPLSPALIDLRVGHILRAIVHPNADSLYVSTIAMGDPEGTEHTQVDEETGKVVRTVCSGLNGLVPLEEMQNRKIIVVANLKPVNMRSIKSAAMVLAASPKAEEGADPHAPDRVVELVSPPEGAEAGDKVFFEGWPYGDGRGPEKQLNPKKKQWEAIQPGFYTNDECVVGFDSSKSEIAGAEKGDLIVEGKGRCTVKTLKGAVVR